MNYTEIKVGKVVDVYDGDTITIYAKFRGVYNLFKVRLYGIDAPEKKGKATGEQKETEQERQQRTAASNAAIAYLKNMVLGKVVRLEVREEKEKYGRILATIYAGKINVCDEMIKKKLAKPQ
jgi:endonuclease YncB( thermonuclease family)